MSNYGPPGSGQYSPTDNIKRKKTRTGEELENVGQNKAVRQYTSAIDGTAKEQAAREAKKVKEKSGPVKVYTDEEKAAFEAQRKAQYDPFAKDELEKRAPKDFSPEKAESHERCVMDLKAEGKSVGSAHAICTSAMKGEDFSELQKDEEMVKYSENGQWSLEKVDTAAPSQTVPSTDSQPKKVVKPKIFPSDYKGPETNYDTVMDNRRRKKNLRKHDGQQWDMEKAEEGRGGRPKDISMFTSDHINAVVKMPHDKAKELAHQAVEGSTAKPENKVKAKAMIDKSKNPKHLALGMANFLLSAEGLSTK